MSRSNFGQFYESGLEAYIAKCSGILFWFIIFSSGVNGLANLYVWYTGQVEAIRPEVRGAVACLGVFNFSFFVLFCGAGLIRLRGSTSSLRYSDFWQIALFISITIAPFFFWAVRGNIVSSPLEQDALAGWIAAFQLITLAVGLTLASEATIGLHNVLQAHRIVSWVYDWVSLPFSAVRYARAVLIGAWRSDTHSLMKIDKSDAENVRGSRQPIYTDEGLVAQFQDSVLTRFSESNAISALPPFQTFADQLAGEFRVLDIGGGEGEATAALICQLIANSAVDVKVITIDLFESAVLAERYERLMHERFGKTVSVNMRGMFEADSDLEQYGLIILFHCLYSLIDASRSRSALSTQVPLLRTRLLASLDSSGLIIGSLASSFGQSASFKRKCMMEAFGRTIQDITFEELSTYWKPDAYKIVDTHFKFVGDESGRIVRSTGVSWIRYFARISAGWLSESQERLLFQHLMVRCIAFEDLDEASKKLIKSIDSEYEETLNRTKFLPHKTGVFLLCKQG